MGIKARSSDKPSSTRRRNRSSKGMKESLLSKEEVMRRLRLLVLTIGLKQRLVATVVCGLVCCVVLTQLVYGFGFSLNGLTMEENKEREEVEPLVVVETGEQLLARMKKNLGGFGSSVEKEDVFLRKSNIKSVEVPYSMDKIGPLIQALALIDHQATKGWNVTTPNVQPLGQLGYVKRDLPVYKEGLSKLDRRVTVLPRPKSGLFSSEQLAGSSYNVIMCLSFNTDHCFDPDLHHLIDKSKKVNRIQNLRDTIWSKHKFCRTMSASTKGLTDNDLLSFTFPCWVMPQDYDRMVKYSRANNIGTWIAKPRSLGAGMGIYVITDLDDLEHERSTSNVVQTYLEEPHLIEKTGLNGKVDKFKWDMRSYVLVTSVTPLRAYVFTRGLIRISTSPYTKDCKGNITACLTNTSLNKKVEGANLKDITWSFKKLKDYLTAKQGPDWTDVMKRIRRAIGLTLLSSESEILKQFTPKGFRCENCYQLLGVDLLFDAAMNPKVVEVNGEPNLKTTNNGKTHYDFTKKNMAKDLVAIVLSKKSQNVDAAKRLVQWANAAKLEDGRPIKLGEDHLNYILATMREHASLGGFLPVYPTEVLSEPYGRYLRFLRDKEAKQSSSDILVHADGRRYQLHQVMTLLQNTEALSAVKMDETSHGSLRHQENLPKSNQAGKTSKKTVDDQDIF